MTVKNEKGKTSSLLKPFYFRLKILKTTRGVYFARIIKLSQISCHRNGKKYISMVTFKKYSGRICFNGIT